MANLNFLQMMSLISTKGPQAAAEEIIKTNYPNDPTMNQLLQMGYSGDTKGLEQIAQQYCQQNGRDFTAEMNSIMQMLGMNR